MRYVKISGLPSVKFAHTFGAQQYDKILPVRDNRIEISYVSEGASISEGMVSRKYNISCNLFDKEKHIVASSFHEHRTVCFNVKFDIFDKKQEGAVSLPEKLLLLEYGKPHELIDKIIRIYTISPENTLELSGLFLELLSEYSKQSEIPQDKAYGKASVYADGAKEYIYDHLHEPITQREIARHLGITPEYLCAVFKRANGISVMKFINKIKLSKIQDTIKRENLKLYEAAELYGYSDPNYVSRLRKSYDL